MALFSHFYLVCAIFIFQTSPSQYQNRQKILLNRKRSEEHRARTHRLIGRGAILEAVFPSVVDMDGEEVKAFLIALSRLPGAAELAENPPETGDEK